MRPRDRSSLFIVPAVLALLLGAGLPVDAAGDETPVNEPYGPDTGVFFAHLAKDFECSMAASDMADIDVQGRLYYTTNVADDPCTVTSESNRGARSMFSGGSQIVVHLVPALDQPLELVEGDPITADLWFWTENAGAVSPNVTLRTTSWTGSDDAGARFTVDAFDADPGARVWHRLSVDLGDAPAAFDTGPVSLYIDLDINPDELRRTSALRAGLGVTPDHKSTLTLPLDDQVDNPDDPIDPVEPTWPPLLEDATVRPGVKHVTDRAQCTTNFVFRDLDTDTLYMGTAAHCVDNVGVGGTSHIRTHGGGASIAATVAFSTWETSGVHGDFALMEIPADREMDVHPAVLHFGGPIALASMSDIHTFDKVITYGNSGLRPGPQVLDQHEGYVTGKSAWYTSVYTVTPAIFGDSGSGIMTRDGAAIGAASTIEVYPVPGRNHFANIPPVIDWMNQNGWNLELQTWELLDEGVLPAPWG